MSTTSIQKGQAYQILENGKTVAATIVDVKPQGRGHTVIYRTTSSGQVSLSAGRFAKLLAD